MAGSGSKKPHWRANYFLKCQVFICILTLFNNNILNLGGLGGGCSGPFILGIFWHAMRETTVLTRVTR
jgi:hypothetical protein